MRLHDQRVLSEMLKQNFSAFERKVFQTLHPGATLAPGWHIAVIAECLSDFRDATQYRLIINLPPRHLKPGYARVPADHS